MNSFLLSTQSQHEIQALDNKVTSLSFLLLVPRAAKDIWIHFQMEEIKTHFYIELAAFFVIFSTYMAVC